MLTLTDERPEVVTALTNLLAHYQYLSDDVLEGMANGTFGRGFMTQGHARAILEARRALETP